MRRRGGLSLPGVAEGVRRIMVPPTEGCKHKTATESAGAGRVGLYNRPARPHGAAMELRASVAIAFLPKREGAPEAQAQRIASLLRFTLWMTSFFQLVRGCFEDDDGSLPGVELNNLSPEQVARVYAHVRRSSQVS